MKKTIRTIAKILGFILFAVAIIFFFSEEVEVTMMNIFLHKLVIAPIAFMGSIICNAYADYLKPRKKRRV